MGIYTSNRVDVCRAVYADNYRVFLVYQCCMLESFRAPYQASSRASSRASCRASREPRVELRVEPRVELQVEPRVELLSRAFK